MKFRRQALDVRVANVYSVKEREEEEDGQRRDDVIVELPEKLAFGLDVDAGIGSGRFCAYWLFEDVRIFLQIIRKSFFDVGR